MIFTTFKRIARGGFVNFWRNGFLSFAAIVVITLSLSAFGDWFSLVLLAIRFWRM